MDSDSLVSPALHSPALTGPSVSTPSDGPDTIWTTAMEIALFRAVARHKPVGLHKHFRMMGVVEEYNRQSPIKLNAEDIWLHLANMYDLTSLDEMASAHAREEENDLVELKWQVSGEDTP
ncbi:chromatin modification-related protein EAF7-domain-containing protein [Syncephalis pseudoplumigaleata]|uniref:Chromatin modification-related protein EAF7-domain-containing protein n=1 Tax=Syncephalis pseudoplumigaleata TaxID=1712513 RepID=A0A4P9YUL5_9FUNG|nr:chromatin modification-related protein EAF7-domain-containing protein [Syncephalis pseudoplumigaleata]|eukprot:RKP23657.1 chromatin modification-related protein EAF7-domain-containing protein [Syncephalis pseudoplumigaleata]